MFNISVYDLSGRIVDEIFNGTKSIGLHTFTWDASSLSSGIYFVKLSSNKISKYHKIMLIK